MIRGGRRGGFRESWGLPLVAGGVLAFLVCLGLAAFGYLDAGDDLSPAAAPDVPTPRVENVGATAEIGPADAAPVGDGPRQPTGEPVRIAFGGDVHFEGASGTRLAADPDTVVGPMAERLSAADLAVVNLETAVTTGGTPAQKAYAFRAPPTVFTAMRAAGVDVVSMANNHGMDFGHEGLRDSLRHADEVDFPVIGIGVDDQQAYAPHLVTVHGQEIAIFGATQVMDDELIEAWTAGPGKPGLASAKEVERLAEAIRDVRPQVDTVIVYLHWGLEAATCPTEVQRGLVVPLAEAGADVLVGGHAHVLQGAGWTEDGVYVGYGLGNFVFYASGTGPNTETGVLELTVRGRAVTAANWVPGRIVDGAPQPLDDAAASQALERWNSLRACTGLSASAPRWFTPGSPGLAVPPSGASRPGDSPADDATTDEPDLAEPVEQPSQPSSQASQPGRQAGRPSSLPAESRPATQPPGSAGRAQSAQVP